MEIDNQIVIFREKAVFSKIEPLKLWLVTFSKFGKIRVFRKDLIYKGIEIFDEIIFFENAFALEERLILFLLRGVGWWKL